MCTRRQLTGNKSNSALCNFLRIWQRPWVTSRSFGRGGALSGRGSPVFCYGPLVIQSCTCEKNHLHTQRFVFCYSSCEWIRVLCMDGECCVNFAKTSSVEWKVRNTLILMRNRTASCIHGVSWRIGVQPHVIDTFQSTTFHVLFLSRATWHPNRDLQPSGCHFRALDVSFRFWVEQFDCWSVCSIVRGEKPGCVLRVPTCYHRLLGQEHRMQGGLPRRQKWNGCCNQIWKLTGQLQRCILRIHVRKCEEQRNSTELCRKVGHSMVSIARLSRRFVFLTEQNLQDIERSMWGEHASFHLGLCELLMRRVSLYRLSQ